MVGPSRRQRRGPNLRQRRGGEGQAVVELALIFPIVVLLLLGAVDVGRAIQANTEVADAARQAARMISANAATGDSPFGTYTSGPCQGTTVTSAASGAGCLTNAAALAVVRSVLGTLLPPANVSLYGGATAATCSHPAAGYASVCVAPDERGSPGAALTCPASIPAPGGLGTRYESWSAPLRYRGCYEVQVTVMLGYQPWSTAIAGAGSTINLSSSTTMLADY